MTLGCADSMKLAALDDPEGDRVPAGLPRVVDAHVHLTLADLLGRTACRFFRIETPAAVSPPSA